VKLKKKSTVVELLGELDERWGAQVSAAEFVPLAMGDADGLDDGDDEG
jgi:hypothetical protein